ncbi:MAG: cutinase family protein, partial [Aeromicrobium sp.]
ADSVSITAPTTCLTLAGQVSGHFQGSVRECATGVQAAYSFDARDVDWGGEEGPGLTTPAAQGPVDTYPWKGTTTPPSPQLRPTPTPDPTGTCKDIAVIGVMGSGQRPTAGPLGMGAEVNAVHAKFSEIYGADRVRSVALDYPAKAVPLTENEAPLIAGYIESAWDGTYSLMQALRQQADTCATFDEKVVLVGYSQGAWVIHATVQYLEARKSPLLDRIAGVGLLADPLRSTASDAGLVYAGTAKPEIERLGGSKGIARTKIPNATLEYHKWSAGVFESLIAPGRDIDNVPLSASTYPSRLASSTMSYCDDHDMVCGWSSDQTNSKAPHEAYKNSDNPAVATMAEFLASAASNDQWTSIDSSFGHGCGTRRGGTLWCWGANSKGQLGVGDTVNRASPTRVGTTTNWESVSVGDDFSCAVTTSGELWCWGSASVGQPAQGDGRSSYDNATTPLRVGTDTEWDVVDAGSRAACAIRTDRTLWCWGVLYGGGDIFDDIFGVTSYYPQPKQVGTGADWQSLAAGDQSVCAIKTAGTLWCWGSNGSGRLGTGGSLFKTDVPQRVGVARTWKYVSDSTESACAIASDDSLWCWGANSSGQLGTGDQVGRPMPTQVGIGKRWSQVDTTAAPSVTMAHTCATDTDGELWCWGRGVDSLTQVVSVPVPTRTGARDGWSNLTVAGQNNCAGRKDGSLWCWRLGGTPALAPVAG